MLLISSELEEVLGLAHRVLVMRAGRLVAELEGRRDDRVGDPRRRVRRPVGGRDRRLTGDAGTEQSRTRLAGLTAVSAPRRLRQAGILIPFVVLFVVLSLTSDAFLTKVNLLNILDQQSDTLIIAAAGTLVLVTGGIDLSVGATYSSRASSPRSSRVHHDVVPAILLGIGAGLSSAWSTASSRRCSGSTR